MRHIKKTLFLFFIILISPVLVFAAQQANSRLITVTGDAEVRVVPNEVLLTLGVETWNKQLSTAKKKTISEYKRLLMWLRNIK